MHEILDSFTSYLVAFGLLISSNTDTILTWGGLALLVIRLVADAPRAWKNIRSTWRDD